MENVSNDTISSNTPTITPSKINNICFKHNTLIQEYYDDLIKLIL